VTAAAAAVASHVHASTNDLITRLSSLGNDVILATSYAGHVFSVVLATIVRSDRSSLQSGGGGVDARRATDDDFRRFSERASVDRLKLNLATSLGGRTLQKMTRCCLATADDDMQLPALSNRPFIQILCTVVSGSFNGATEGRMDILWSFPKFRSSSGHFSGRGFTERRWFCCSTAQREPSTVLWRMREVHPARLLRPQPQCWSAKRKP